jgi:uncharacterized protein
MDATTSDLEPVGLAHERPFFGRLADGLSQPPWSWRKAAMPAVVSLAGYVGLQELSVVAADQGLPDLNLFWPCLVCSIPMLYWLVNLTRQGGTTVGRAFGLRGARVRRVVVSGIVLHILETLASVAVTVLLVRLGCERGTGAREETVALASSFFTITDTIVWAPVCEELLFRGLLYTSLRTRLGIVPSSIVTAALFSAIHYPESLVPAAALFVPAVLSSLWYERTRSLWPNIISHSLTNALVLVFNLPR